MFSRASIRKNGLLQMSCIPFSGLSAGICNAGHRGTDIPAPEGTPILAAHSGTVLVSGWNDSYGNQVLLDNGAGLGRPQLNSKS